MPRLRDGSTIEDRRLDLIRPSDERHRERYPLTAATIETAKGNPVVLGIPWYAAFDSPVARRGSFGRTEWWIPDTTQLGVVRGGHAICTAARNRRDPTGWRRHYDQGVEGACVGASESRMMSLLNRKRYAFRWLYYEAQKIDEWPGGEYPGASPVEGGTSLRAGFDVLRERGHRAIRFGKERDPDPREGISANRWAESMDDIFRVIASPQAYDRQAVPLLNSWGDSYPRLVWMPASVAERVIFSEWGEAGVVTDR